MHEFRVLTYLLLFLVLETGCAVIVLDNDKLYEVQQPDPLRFSDPICVTLDFKINNLDEKDTRKPPTDMSENGKLERTFGLYHYNISLKCQNPAAQFTIQYSYHSDGALLQILWALTSFYSVGIIPFYAHDTGVVSVFENGNLIYSAPWEQKRFASIFAIPWRIADDSKAIKIYKMDALRATNTRFLASVIKSALEVKNKINRKK